MWTRKELKDRAKGSFKANYWKSALVALVLAAVVSGLVSFPSVPHTSMPSATPAKTSTYSPDNVNVELKDGKVRVDVDDSDGGKVHVDIDSDDLEDVHSALEDTDENDTGHVMALATPVLVLTGLSFAFALLVGLAFLVALYVFALSPLEAGAQRFFVRNLNQAAEVRELAFGYDNNYKETVKTLFLRDLFVFLWALLLIVPGIYKAYEYRMIPYLLAEDPAMTKDRAFSESKRLMDGQKWNAFVLDLSFLGWNILSALTLGILGVFYVGPYQAQTNAALYEKLRYGQPADGNPQQAIPVAPSHASNAQAQAGAGTQTQDQALGQARTQGQPQAQAVPVIVPDSQPPVPPFAQVGFVAESEADATGLTHPVLESAATETAALPEPDVDPTAPLPASADDGEHGSSEA